MEAMKVLPKMAVTLPVGRLLRKEALSAAGDGHKTLTSSESDKPEKNSDKVSPRKTEISPSGPESANNYSSVQDQRSIDELAEKNPAHSEQSAARADQDDRVKKQEALENLVKKLEPMGDHSLEVKFLEESQQFVVKVIDPETKEEIRQIPPERLLSSLEIQDEIKGELFDAKS